MTKYVYYFGDGHAEGNAKMKDVLGGKGAGLAEMTNIGVPVPPGFTISTAVCTYFYEHGKQYPPALRDTAGVQSDAEIPAEALRELVATYKKIVREKTGKDFPQDVHEQLWGAIGAVFYS